MRIFAQKLHTGLDFEPMTVADTIVKSFEVFADDRKIYEADNNYHSLVKIPLCINAKNITVRFKETHGHNKINLYACDFI